MKKIIQNLNNIIFVIFLFCAFNVNSEFYVRDDQQKQIDTLKKICDPEKNTFDEKKCYEEAENSAIRGELAGKIVFAEILKTGVCGKIDQKKAFFWYNEAYKEGSVLALSSLIPFYINGEVVPKDLAKAFELSKEAVKYGMTRPMLYLGDMYLYGIDGVIEKDINKAIKWYKKAKDSGDSHGYLKLSGIYANDKYVTHDWKKCVSYREKAVEMGNDNAFLALGVLYEIGACGKSVDINKAARLYFDGITASKGINFNAIYSYSRIVIEKYDPELDKEAIERGYKYLEYIANKGYAKAQKLLINYYRHGAGGIGKQEIKAKYWEEIYRNNPNLSLKK